MNHSRIREYVAPAFIFVVVLAVYVYTLCPTVYWDDAGELIAACYTLGIPHPPGHPLYAMLGKLFTLIPIGLPAYRVNLMSAFFGALTCALLFQIVRELARREGIPTGRADFAASVAALGAAFSLLAWDQSVVAETTSLHTFFMMLATLLAFRIYSEPEHPHITRRLLVFAFLYGLSFTNHVAALFFMPSLMLLLLVSLRGRLFRPARFSAMVALFFAPLILYAYLPLRSRFNPAIDWGNPENLHNFLWVVTARQYSSNLWQVPTLVGFTHGLRNISKELVSNLTVIGLSFSLIGAAFLWIKRKWVLIYSVIVIGILFFVTLNSAFISAYLVPAILLFAMWLGYGIALLLGQAELTSKKALIVEFLAVILVAGSLALHFPQSNKRGYRYAEEYGRELLSSLPENAILITGSADPLFISWYLQICEGFRTDIKIITRNGLTRPGYLDDIRRRYPNVEIPVEFQYDDESDQAPATNFQGGLPGYANAYFKALWELNARKFPIFWEGSESNHLLMERFVPYRFVYQVLPPDEHPSAERFVFLDSQQIEKQIHGDAAAGRVYGNHVFNHGVYYQWLGDQEHALEYYRQTLSLNPRDTRALNNMGGILFAQGNEAEAVEEFSTAFHIDPNDVASNHNLGQALLTQNNPDKAIPFFERAVKYNPANFEDYYNLGLCHASIGENREAVKMFQKSLQLKPDSPEALSSLGVVYLRQKDLSNAEKVLTKAVQLEPNNAENWYNLACLQTVKRDTSSSADSMKRALSLDPRKVSKLAAGDKQMLPLLNSLRK